MTLVTILLEDATISTLSDQIEFLIPDRSNNFMIPHVSGQMDRIEADDGWLHWVYGLYWIDRPAGHIVYISRMGITS